MQYSQLNLLQEKLTLNISKGKQSIVLFLFDSQHIFVCHVSILFYSIRIIYMSLLPFLSVPWMGKY